VKYGLVWNVENRRWVHWDGNTQSPLGRNLLASAGLGAPLIGKRCYLDFALVKRQTDLSERIHAPRYPFAIDEAAAKRGAAHYQAQCTSCHGGPESDKRLYATAETGTDPTRAEAFTPLQAERFNKFLAELETPGYKASSQPGIRSTQKYWAASLPGVWARSPYLHNGSVRTMQELLTPPAVRAKTFHRGSRVYDAMQMGYADDGIYVLDTAGPGNSNTGHDYGTNLSADQKRELVEYLKTL
jgi:mono/diheme cytochrome c family protein